MNIEIIRNTLYKVAPPRPVVVAKWVVGAMGHGGLVIYWGAGTGRSSMGSFPRGLSAHFLASVTGARPHGTGFPSLGPR